MDQDGMSEAEVQAALQTARAEDATFHDGGIMGSMCTAPHPVARTAHDLFLETNLGDPGHFPGTARLEREVLKDLCDLLEAPADAAARYLTGGTEANLLAAYIARERTGNDVIVVPDSAHFSFEKAARMLRMRLRYVRTDATGHADVAAMAEALDDAALLVGVAGTTELGLVDPIPALAAVARDADVPLHVDAALGGYLLPFLAAAGYAPRPFSFDVDGVWSIGLDPHKAGMATIPGGALVLRDGDDWDRIAVDTPYVSTSHQTSIMGTRPGAAVAACWAIHRYLGRSGYARIVKDCLDRTRRLADALTERGADLVAKPELNVVAFRTGDPTRTAERLARAGCRVNVVPRFNALRVVVNPHVTDAAIERLLSALGT